MKTYTTKNLASAVLFVILTPFLALAMFVGVKTAGVLENDFLLLLLTLCGAVLSGINGFGRRTIKPVPVTTKTVSKVHNVSWSTRPSTNA